MNRQMPTFEPFEPRLLMSGTPMLDSLFASAELLDVAPGMTVSADGQLATSDASMMYSFTNEATGTISLALKSADGQLDPYLKLYDANHRLLASNDNQGGSADSLITRYVSAGQMFYVQAGGARSSTGDYSLSLTSKPTDDVGNDAARAAALYVAANGSSTKNGNIQYSNDTDCFAYTAKYSGLVQTTVAATGYRSSLAAVLTVRDAEGNVMGTAQAGAGGALDLSFTAVQGQRYFFSISGADSSQGTYSLKVLPTIWQDFIDATEVNIAVAAGETLVGTLGAGGALGVNGTLGVNGKATYKITVPANGYFQFNMRAADGSGIDSYLEVYTQDQRRLAYNDNAGAGRTDSQVRLYVREGQVLYVRALAAKGSEGDYALTFQSQPTDDVGNDAASAAAMSIAANGSSSKNGNIQYGNDTDCFAYTAKYSGLVQTTVAATGYRSSLVAVLTVRDAEGNVMGTGQAAAGGAMNLSFTAIQGQTYFFSVSGAGNSRGTYSLKVLPTVWQDFIDATDVTVAAATSETIAGTLGVNGRATYKITVPATGYSQFNMRAADGSGIDSCLEVYTQDQRRLTYNDNATRVTNDSQVRLAVREGQVLYVRASATKGTGGNYALTFQPPSDDVGNNAARAAAMAMGASGTSTAVAAINYGSDVDVFKFNATVTGDMTVSMAKYGVSNLIGAVRALNVAGAQLAADDASDGTAQITFHVVAGETYYLSAASVSRTTGWYVLIGKTQANPNPATPDPTPDPTPEPTPVPSDTPSPGASVNGTVQQSGGTTRLVVTGTNGNDVITLSYNGSATILASGAGTQTFAGYYGYISVYGFGGDDVIRLDYSITGSTLVYAGDGNDKLYENSQGAATIYGGAGDDLLVAVGGGNDVVYGESGTDSYWADTTDTLADSTSAEAAAKNIHRIAGFYQPYSADPASVDYVSKDINGQNLRDPYTTYGVSNYANRPLFVDGPQYDDIRQGALGDCYYLAVLASMSDTDPNLIRQAITDLGDGTYAVRYYRGGAEVYLRLDAHMPSAYAALTPDGETWVMLMEKAYAFFRYGSNCYSSIEGGWMSTVVGELTGASSQTQWTGGSATLLASTISTNLAAGHSLTLGSYSNAASPVVGGHAYMIKSIEGVGDAAYVTVYNPWGVDGRSYDGNYNDGLLRLSMAQIQACFSAIVIALV